MSKARVAAALLIASAALLTTLEQSEGFVEQAMKPVPEDRWTYGYGSTTKADGSPVQPGDRISRVEARQLMEQKVHDEFESRIYKCAGDVLMFQSEFDSLIDLAYNVGASKVCTYSIIRKFREGNYLEGCQSILTIDILNGKHCSQRYNYRNVPGCRGIMNRRQKQYRTCMGEHE